MTPDDRIAALAALATAHADDRQYSVGPLTMDRVFKAAGLTNMSDMQAVLDAIEVALASAPAGDGELRQAAERVQRRVGEWDGLQGWEPRDRFAAFGESLRHDAMTLVVAALARPRAAVGEPDRVALAQIIDPTAWQTDSDGYHVEQVHSDAALATADQIMGYLAALQSPPAKVEGQA